MKPARFTIALVPPYETHEIRDTHDQVVATAKDYATAAAIATMLHNRPAEEPPLIEAKQPLANEPHERPGRRGRKEPKPRKATELAGSCSDDEEPEERKNRRRREAMDDPDATAEPTEHW